MLSELIVSSVSFTGHLLAAVASCSAAIWVARRSDAHRVDRPALLVTLVLFAIWAIIAATTGPNSTLAVIADSCRMIAAVILVLRLFANDGRDASVAAVRPVVAVLIVVAALQPVIRFLSQSAEGDATQAIFSLGSTLGMLVCVGALVLLHNLYSGAASSSRQILRWSLVALAGLWTYDLNYYLLSYLSGEPALLMQALRGALSALAAVLLALGGNASTAELQFRPSRKVAFRSLSLLLIGAYLGAMFLLAQSLSVMGGNWENYLPIAMLIAATIGALMWLPSKRLRAQLRVMAAKHLFSHRYDYREEWLRFTRTIGRGGGEETLHQRVIKAMADITDSPRGLLLVPNEKAELELLAQWQWSNLEVPSVAAPYQLAGLLEAKNYILDLDELRGGVDRHGEGVHVPGWLVEAPEAWALVPLLHFDRLVGAVVLARPATRRQLDWEDLDLLRVVAQQLASYLAEHSGQQALMEASRFDEFNRRIAFVMHDIKNLASQLSLLARNAEKHAENPDFRADMLVTLRNSSDKLNALISRLSRYGAGQGGVREEVELSILVRSISERMSQAHPVHLARAEKCPVRGDPEGIEQALVHLIQNAIDASAADVPVVLDIFNDGVFGRIEVIDTGKGMSPGFVHDGLFKPFVSSKEGGFGIGAFEARELIRGMGGQLEVESREGMGTRFIIKIPKLASAPVAAETPPRLNEVA